MFSGGIEKQHRAVIGYAVRANQNAIPLIFPWWKYFVQKNETLNLSNSVHWSRELCFEIVQDHAIRDFTKKFPAVESFEAARHTNKMPY